MADGEDWRTIARLEEAAPGSMLDVRIDESRSVLLANCDGRLYAIEDRCTHDDGPLADGELLAACQVECPRHGARFDLQTGRALTLPAIRPVASYPVRVSEAGEIQVNLAVESPTPPRPRRGRPR